MVLEGQRGCGPEARKRRRARFAGHALEIGRGQIEAAQLDGLVAARVCSTDVVRAANELGALPGFTERPEFQPELGKGCAARFNSPRPRAEVIERYRSAGVRNGWTLATPQPSDHAVMHKGTLTLDVWANTRDDQGMYIMSVRGA